MSLAPLIEKESSIDGKYIWKIYPAKDGSMYAAISGNGAELYKKSANETNFSLFVKSDNDNAFTAVITDDAVLMKLISVFL